MNLLWTIAGGVLAVFLILLLVVGILALIYMIRDIIRGWWR